jgi:hypothetical protein
MRERLRALAPGQDTERQFPGRVRELAAVHLVQITHHLPPSRREAARSSCLPA